MWALSDFTKENGATMVIPKSHRRPLGDFVPDAEGRDVCYAQMPKGAAVFYLGSTLHGGGRNVTKEHWFVSIFQFVRAFLRNLD
jgi:ectoine hydroxylase-related dioxygenase (phytanoyl-CoA dioxygenase family)